MQYLGDLPSPHWKFSPTDAIQDDEGGSFTLGQLSDLRGCTGRFIRPAIEAIITTFGSLGRTHIAKVLKNDPPPTGVGLGLMDHLLKLNLPVANVFLIVEGGFFDLP